MPIAKFACGICGIVYDTYEEAESCEAVPIRGESFPTGFTFKYGRQSYEIIEEIRPMLRISGRNRVLHHVRRYRVLSQGKKLTIGQNVIEQMSGN